MLIPLAILAFGAVFAGLAFRHVFIGDAWESFWRGAVAAGPDNHIMHDMHGVPSWVGFIATWMMAIGFALAVYMYVVSPQTPAQLAARNPMLYKFLLNKWYFDELYDLIFVRPAFWLGRLFWKGGDGRIIDGLGPDGVSSRVVDLSNKVVRLQTGYVYHYAFAMMLGVAAFITWYLLRGVH